MVYKVIVDWYNDFNLKEERCGLFLVAESYGNAIEKITRHFGETDTNEIKITPWAPDDFVPFELDNPDEDWLFNKIDKDIGEKIIW